MPSEELPKFQGFTDESLIAYAHSKKVINDEQLKNYLFNKNSNAMTSDGHSFSASSK